MSEDSILKCLIAFILGWLICRMMGNGFSVGGQVDLDICKSQLGVLHEYNETNYPLSEMNLYTKCAVDHISNNDLIPICDDNTIYNKKKEEFNNANLIAELKQIHNYYSVPKFSMSVDNDN